MSKYKNAIVITGNIGSGKSTVCEILSQKGFDIIDADKISHEILDDLSYEISLNFGSEFIENGKPNRKKLGTLVFSDKSKLEILENLLHPRIKAEILRKAQILEQTNNIYFIDIPLFFEKQNYNEFEKILLVYAPKELTLERVIKRNNLTKSDALVRINSQLDANKKKKLANFVIDNSCDLDDLKSKVDELIKDIL